MIQKYLTPLLFFTYFSIVFFACNPKQNTEEEKKETTHQTPKEKPLKLTEVLTKHYVWKVSLDSTLAEHQKSFPKTTENGLDSIRQSYEKKDGRYFFEKNQICFVVEKPYPYFVADTFEYDWEVPADAQKIIMKNVETGKEEWKVISFEEQKVIVKPVSPNGRKENANLVFVPAEKPTEEAEERKE